MKIGSREHSQLLHVEWTNKAVLDTRVEHGDGSEKGKGPCSRFLHSCCLLGQNLYLFGGKYNYAPLKDLWKLNIVTQEWTQLETTEIVLPHLQGHTMVSYKSQIFIFGGTFYETSEETPLWIYNPDLNLVKKYTCEEHLPRPVGRREHTAVTYRNVMYVFGGFLDSCGSSEEFWAFDMEAEEWRLILKSKPGPHHGHVAVVHSGCMWIHGGMKNLTYLADVWIYNFALRTWKKVKRSGGTCPSLSDHTANVINDEMILVGGYRNGQLSSDAWIFNFNYYTWRCVETPKDILFPPISLHKSVIIDPLKLAQNDPDASAKSVPDLKTKLPLLPWHEQTNDVRPWTSAGPGSCVDYDSRPALDRQLPILLDKNNNSEEDITALVWEDLVCKFSIDEDCYKAPDLEQVGENKFESDFQQGSKMSKSKIDILKIRPSSIEDCQDDLPLLERFNSVGSDVDFGEHNTLLSLSDEYLPTKPAKEDHQYFISSSCNRKNPSTTQSKILKDSSSGCEAWETPAENFTTLFSNHNSCLVRSSASFENRARTPNICDRTLLGDDKENSFTNPLYEKLYISEQNLISSHDSRYEDSLIKASSSAPKYLDKSHSSNLVVEDLEMSEDDLILRHVKLASPVKLWSSMKNLPSSRNCPVFDMDFDGYLCVLRQEKRSKSLSCLKNDDNEFLDFNEGSVTDSCKYEKQIRRHGGHYSVDAVKKLARNSKGISKAYVKNSNPSNIRNSGSHLHTQNQHCLTSGSKQNAYLYSGPSQLLLSSEFRQSKATRNPTNYKNFLVQPKNVPEFEYKGYEEKMARVCPPKAHSELKSDQKLILVILGGQTESQSIYSENLKMWNCYLK